MLDWDASNPSVQFLFIDIFLVLPIAIFSKSAK